MSVFQQEKKKWMKQIYIKMLCVLCVSRSVVSDSL